jgi:hypothetical protein
MKKLILVSVILLLSACNMPSPVKNSDSTSNLVTPTRPVGAAKSSFAVDGLKMELFFQDNHYVYYGNAQLPTPCYVLTVNSVIAESYPEQVTLNLVTKKDPGKVCAQVITSKIFSGTLEVSENAVFSVNYNGNAAQQM